MDFALVISVLVLIAAPLLAKLVNHYPSIKGGLDGFVLVTVLALIILTLLPEALNTGGIAGLVIAAFGFFLPWITEQIFHKSEEVTHRVLMFIAALALIIHAASDGAILAFANNTQHGSFVATGVILHRIGVAIAVWWLLRPILTTFGGIAVLLALSAVTIVGYLMVIFAGEWYSGVPLVGYWQAFAAGSLFHIVMHPLEDHNTAPAPETNTAHRIGTAFGILFVISLISAHYLHHAPSPLVELPNHSQHHDVDTLYAVGRLIAPIMLLITIGVGVYAHLQGKRGVHRYQMVQTVAPWTLFTWLGLSILADLLPDYLPVAEHGGMIFALWLTALAAIIIHTGARTFFSVLMPSFILHKHSHSHSHH